MWNAALTAAATKNLWLKLGNLSMPLRHIYQSLLLSIDRVISVVFYIEHRSPQRGNRYNKFLRGAYNLVEWFTRCNARTATRHMPRTASSDVITRTWITVQEAFSWRVEGKQIRMKERRNFSGQTREDTRKATETRKAYTITARAWVDSSECTWPFISQRVLPHQQRTCKVGPRELTDVPRTK